MKAPRLMNDRLSQLPQRTLHRILRYLPQQEAVRTCVLSKSWRYLGSRRPSFDMREIEFKGSKRKFINVLEKSLQLYHHHKIRPQEFCLSMSTPDVDSVLFLHKWIPVLIRDWAVEDFRLSFDKRKHALFDLPSVVFESESLQSLCLTDCTLRRVSCFDKEILSVNLKELCLWNVFITEEILEKIICSCPLIKLELSRCVGLRVIRVDKRARFLKRFTLNGGQSLEIDVPSLEKIVVFSRLNWYHDMNNYFPLLKSLSLYGVRLSIESFYFFSLNFPCLESLSFKHCYGFVDFELSHRSVKELEITVEEPLNRVAIDVPSIVMFKYEGCCVPESFSFMTNSKKWKSDITLPPDYFYNENSPRLGKVGQLLRAVSGSEISLDIGEFDLSPQFVPVFMDNIFCICRLRIIQWSHLVRPEYMYMLYETLKHMCMFLGMEMGEFVSVRHWRRQDLEKITFETSDDNEEKWHPIVERSWSEFRDALSVRILRLKHRMRFRLTWRE